MTGRAWPLLATATAALLVAGTRFIRSGLDALAAVTFAAGLIVLGAWLAVEVRGGDHRKDAEPPPGPGPTP